MYTFNLTNLKGLKVWFACLWQNNPYDSSNEKWVATIYQVDGHLIDHLMEAPNLDANVDMARLVNDAFVMVD
jgi:hypothetical protein